MILSRQQEQQKLAGRREAGGLGFSKLAAWFALSEDVCLDCYVTRKDRASERATARLTLTDAYCTIPTLGRLFQFIWHPPVFAAR